MGKKSGEKQGKKAADVQAQAEKEIATAGTYADRPDQYNPWGSLTWEQKRVRDPGTGKRVTKWVQNQALSPEMQRLYDMSMEDKLQGSEVRQGLLNRAYADVAEGPDWAQFGEAQGLDFTPDEMRQRAEDMAYQREAMRLDPQFTQEQSKLESKLANQGLSPGDRAYDAAMSSFMNSKTDAYERARLGAAQAGRDEVSGMWGREVEANQLANALRDQQIQEYIAKRGYSLGEAQMYGEGTAYATAAAEVGGA